jgi:hypothetical protein
MVSNEKLSLSVTFTWRKGNGLTIKDFAPVLQSVSEKSKKSPQKVVDEFHARTNKQEEKVSGKVEFGQI